MQETILTFYLDNLELLMKKEKALMKVIEKVGSTNELARILGCSASYVSNWTSGYRKIPIKYVKKIVELSEGELRKKDLRPDVYDD